jgi:hypothetical protein
VAMYPRWQTSETQQHRAIMVAAVDLVVRSRLSALEGRDRLSAPGQDPSLAAQGRGWIVYFGHGHRLLRVLTVGHLL